MSKIVGIQTERDENGILKTVTFDVKKHGEILKPILENLGVIEDGRPQKKFYSINDAKTETKKRLAELCKKDDLL